MDGLKLDLIGDEPLKRDGKGNLLSRIGTLFVEDRTLITVGGKTHASQRMEYLRLVNEARAAKRRKPIVIEQLCDAVDLIMEGPYILIRPEPSCMELAYEADELLQTIASKQEIRFLHAHWAPVQEAIREHGDYWRISPHPKKETEVVSAIEQSKIAIGGLPIYYYSSATGTRYLSLQTFRGLGGMEAEPLRLHLVEIKEYSQRRNRGFYPEVALFGLRPDSTFDAGAFKAYDFAAADEARLRAWHGELCDAFEEATEERLLNGDVGDAFWRNRLFARLVDERNDTQSEKLIGGLTEEFFRQIEWLPGGRIDKTGELLFDPVFDEPLDQQVGLCDVRVKGFIFNYVREFGDLEYVNIGRLLPGLRKKPAPGAHRAYIAEVKSRNMAEPVLRILRVQKWGIAERLRDPPPDADNPLLSAILETQYYTEYTLNRRSGCGQLGMPLPKRIDVRNIPEDYLWGGKDDVSRIWVTYFERDFIEGLATDKITKTQLGNADFARRLAKCLGYIAAPNIVVGRMTADESEAIFDQGDEILILDEEGLPREILAADYAGTFVDYKRPLIDFAEAYANPVLSRWEKIPAPDREEFAATYLASMKEHLIVIQEKCRFRRRELFSLFVDYKGGEKSFVNRWEDVIDRLAGTDVEKLIAKIRAVIDANKAPRHAK